MKKIVKISAFTTMLALSTLLSCETKKTNNPEKGTDGPTTIDATVSESESGKTIPPNAAAEANAASGTADSAAAAGTAPAPNE